MRDLPTNMSGLGAGMAGAPGASTAVSRGPMPAGPAMPKGQPASAEEQQLYDQFVKNAISLMMGDGRGRKAVDAMNTMDPQDGVARVVGPIVAKVAKAAQDGGTPLPFDVILHGTAEIVDNAMELAEAAGIHEFSKDGDAQGGAYVRALDAARVEMQNRGLIDQEQAKAMFAEVQQVDQAGAPGMAGPAAGAPPASPGGAGGSRPAPAAGGGLGAGMTGGMR